MLALYSILALPVALVVPLVVVRTPRPLPVAILFVVAFAVGYGGMIFAPPASAVVWVAIAGLGQGVYSFAFTMINKRTRTQSGSGVLSGFAQGVGYALASVGPFLFGLLHHPGDGWLPSFGMLGAWLLVLLAGAMMVNKPRFLEDAFQVVQPGTKETAAEPDCSRSQGRNIFRRKRRSPGPKTRPEIDP